MKYNVLPKTLLCAALCAAVCTSTAVTVFAGRNVIPENEIPDYKINHSFGIAGTFTDWGGDEEKGTVPDIPMADADGDGVFTGVVCGIGEGIHEFKVRTDNSWEDSWGEFEYALGKTLNSQTNCSVSVNDVTDLIVTIDTKAKDPSVWQITSYSTEEISAGKYGLSGSPNKWDQENDIPMYEVSLGKYIGIFKDVPAGKHEFKIRADGVWSDDDGICNWGPYDENTDSTIGSKENVKLELEAESDIVVMFDTSSGEDEDSRALWPISYMTVSDGKITSAVYTGKERVPEEEPGPEDTYIKTEITDYLFFDNSETKWDEVYAYWWHDDYARTFDLENKDYGCTRITNEDGSEGYMPTAFPGTAMTNITGTDIWQLRIPYNAQKIIFSSGKTDEQIAQGEQGWQTKDIALDTSLHAGMIWTVDINGGIETGSGIEKTKNKYQKGSWSEYTGDFISEEIGTPKEEPTDDPGEDPGNDPGEDPGDDPGVPGDNSGPDQPGTISGEGSTETPDENSSTENEKPQPQQNEENEKTDYNSKTDLPVPATGDSFPAEAATIMLLSAAVIAAAIKKHSFR